MTLVMQELLNAGLVLDVSSEVSNVLVEGNQPLQVCCLTGQAKA